MLESRRITSCGNFWNQKSEKQDYQWRKQYQRSAVIRRGILNLKYWRPKERWRIFFIEISFIRRNFVGAGGDLTTFVVQKYKIQKIKKIKLKIQNLHQHWSKSLKISTTIAVKPEVTKLVEDYLKPLARIARSQRFRNLPWNICNSPLFHHHTTIVIFYQITQIFWIELLLNFLFVSVNTL